MPMTLFTW